MEKGMGTDIFLSTYCVPSILHILSCSYHPMQEVLPFLEVIWFELIR